MMKRIIGCVLLIGLCFILLCCDEGEKENYMIINGQKLEYSVKDKQDNENHMIPVAQLFVGMGFSIEKDGDMLYLDNNDYHFILDLQKMTLINPEKPWYNYLATMPGETGEEQIMYRYGEELFVCKRYIYSMFQLMGGSVHIRIDEKTGIITIDATIS